jgi:hypothetical protein
MRTKALLSMAALAAGALTAAAQSNVYSLNIVGYVNVTTPVGYSFQSNPLDAAPDNTAANVIANPDPTQDYSGPWDNSTIQTWTGLGWKVSAFDSVTTDTTTGFTDVSGAQTAAPVLSSGLGYLINNGQGAVKTITYVGTVRTGTNSITYPTSARAYAIGSMLPLGGGVITALGMSNPDPTQDYSGPLDNSYVEFLKVSAGGQALGYSVAQFDSVTTDTTTGFTDVSGAQIPEPQVNVGGGFLFVSQGTSAFKWTQILNP